MKRRMRLLQLLVVGGAGLAAAITGQAQVTNPRPVPPLEVRQDATAYNLQSTNGVPLSTTRGDPPGSDGRGPTLAGQSADGLTLLPATPRQFSAAIVFGAVAAPRGTNLSAGLNYAQNAGAANLDLPRAESGGTVLAVMTLARVGSPILSRQVAFLFGAVIPVPDLDVEGEPLAPGVVRQDYWLPEPHRPTTLGRHEILDLGGLASRLSAAADPVSAYLAGRLEGDTLALLATPGEPLRDLLVRDFNNIISGPSIYTAARFTNVVLSVETQNLRPDNIAEATPARVNRLLIEDALGSLVARTAGNYYWSPHARAVYAIQPGPVDIVWKKSVPSSEPPPDLAGNPGRYSFEAGSYYTLFATRYVVSGSAVKPPRKIYWTEESFRTTGKPVAVPAGRIGVINVVNNNNFPERVAQAHRPLGQTPLISDSSQQLEEKRTLWYDKQLRQILAYNVEGRVLVELLGDTEANGRTRRPLGVEIVDVVREPIPANVTVELGEILTAYPSEEAQDDSALYPEPIDTTGPSFYFRQFVGASDRPVLHAIRETRNVNDLQVHWLEVGLEGLRWPFRFVRYRQVWPDDAAKYSHYVRPLVATEAEARATAVPLPAENAPLIDYQDPLDQPRGKLTETFAYYSFLSEAYPAHRALLRFSSAEYIRFERVYSWLDRTLLGHGSFAGSVATNLAAWDPGLARHDFPSEFAAPRVYPDTVEVGRRIHAPPGELAAAGVFGYLAGYIHQPAGDSFHVGAYGDPFQVGFEAAARGAIIPVNVIPGRDRLEVWWFRGNAPDLTLGFQPIYWPSAIGRYTLVWPSAPSEIVLASNDGSGALPSLEAKGRIYTQNDPGLPGYNPNEEHALMQGGQAFALRDDLNITSGAGFSSLPYVLLDYTEADDRPAMRVFRVRRERPETGDTFDYTVVAGTILQPPMPLPLLDKPFAPRLIGAPPRSLNREIGAWTVAASGLASEIDVPLVELTTVEVHGFPTHRLLTLQDPGTTPFTRATIFPLTVDYGAKTLRGVIPRQAPDTLSTWGGDQATGFASWRFAIDDAAGLAEGDVLVVAEPRSRQHWRVSVSATNEVAGLHYVEVGFLNLTEFEQGTNATVLVRPTSGLAAGAYTGWRLAFEPLPDTIPSPDLRDTYASFLFQDRKGNLWVYRGPHDEADTATLGMQFYYKTLPGFHFPSLSLAAQPPVGTITPYLRAQNPDGSYVGHPVYGNALHPQEGDDNPLVVTYSPVWPPNAPVLQMAETLTLPKRGLPSVRGQTSLEILYQQSQVLVGESAESAVLHDPTREKVFELGPRDGAAVLGAVPDSVRSQTFRGRTYFPNLPPHLVERFSLDPTRGENGALVLAGQFVDEALGDDYLLLNVMGARDVVYLKDLCLGDDPAKERWDAAIDGLTTRMELFVENPGRPGTYLPSTSVPVGPRALARVTNDDIAVDSYALTATGPGTGYVTLVAGNGLAFTPVGEPVSLHILRVVDTLYRGELKIVASSNPLNESLTLQQVVDLAGAAEDFNFEWKIASPVDGLPPVVYETTAAILMGSGTWQHVRFPLPGDQPAAVKGIPAHRVSADVVNQVFAISGIPFAAVSRDDDLFRFDISGGAAASLAVGNAVVLGDADGQELFGTVHPLSTTAQLVVQIEPGQPLALGAFAVIRLHERAVAGQRQSLVFREFTRAAASAPAEVWLSLDVDPALGARVYLDGQLAVTVNLGEGDTAPSTAPANLSPLSRAYRLDGALLAGGAAQSGGLVRHLVSVELFSTAMPNAAQAFNLRLEMNELVDVTDAGWLPLDVVRYPDGVRAVLGGTADVRSLADNYLIMRYQARDPGHASFRPAPGAPLVNAAWSAWTRPQLAEGWIKRVLAGINPFNQRITDLFNNSLNTDVSIIAQAGPRWEGDVALNLDTINDSGLIEIYETVLNRGRMLSIGGGINYGPANDALLLAAGYLNDLYMMLGNEAWADAANPTIGIGTKDHTYSDIATALFSFRGQLPSLLDEELALLRGRDDFLLPGVEVRPVYNRLIWNYTRGIDAGEVVYALNYNILDQNQDGRVDADDARRLYPQGHGDAYGHYLTALKGYYGLLMDTDFDWVPRIEAVTVLGQPVSVDYQDERKFAAAAAAVARAGKQIFDLTWRRDYRPGADAGWEHLAQTRVNTTTRSVPTTRYWGADHWASRTGQGAYLNWVVGNAILPDVDPDPSHEGGIQQIDRTTVLELRELPALAASLQTAMDNAEAGLTPLGLPEGTVPFDIDPSAVVGVNGSTHFEQVYERARAALRNALAAFDDAKDVTRQMRSEEDSLADFRTVVNRQELAYTNTLIELYGTPYSDDIGPGRTYRQGFAGPDTIHFMYVDTPELSTSLLNPQEPAVWRIDTQTFRLGWVDSNGISDFNWITKARVDGVDGPLDPTYEANDSLSVEYTLAPHGFFEKPSSWTGRRSSPGRLQQAISDIIKARNAAYLALYDIDAAKGDLDWAIKALERKRDSHQKVRDWQTAVVTLDRVTKTARLAYDIGEKYADQTKEQVLDLTDAIVEAIPENFVAGLAVGGDLTAPARAAVKAAGGTVKNVTGWARVIFFSLISALEFANETSKELIEFTQIAPEQWDQELREATSTLRDAVYGVQNKLPTLNQRLQELDDARRRYQSLLAEGDRIQQERQIFRQRAAAVIQGFRTRDAAFRIFRNEKLERYKSLFDLAAQYAFMAAQSYDYETGLLHTTAGKDFVQRIVRSRALGVMTGGEPQFAGSNTGDPGLSSALAEMHSDWLVLKGRLGFRNPDAYGTTVSLRTEHLRILPGMEGDANWKDFLARSRMANVLDDADVRRYCLQIDAGNGLPVPGIVVEFATTIADRLNLFGRPLAAGDHAFSPSSFATKIFAVGVALEGYLGMADPAANSGAVSFGGGTSPADPSLAFLNPRALAATPYVYLIPVGLDSMRSPPLGDSSVVRTWAVEDVTIPLPFNIGASGFSSQPLWQSRESLSEPLFGVRKHQAFRPVSTSARFLPDVYGPGGTLMSSQFTNRRLIGRSVWNSRWKLVIPGHTLLHDPNEGLERLIQSVHDIRLHYVTYSYSGN